MAGARVERVARLGTGELSKLNHLPTEGKLPIIAAGVTNSPRLAAQYENPNTFYTFSPHDKYLFFRFKAHLITIWPHLVIRDVEKVRS